MQDQVRDDRPHDEPRAVVLDTPEFDRFQLWLESELESLVGSWSHMAAPGAERKAERIYLHNTRKAK